jgi:hypothetical protein
VFVSSRYAIERLSKLCAYNTNQVCAFLYRAILYLMLFQVSWHGVKPAKDSPRPFINKYSQYSLRIVD